MIDLVTRSVVALVVTLGVAGCSGGSEQEQVFTAADDKRLAEIRPVTPGWAYGLGHRRNHVTRRDQPRSAQPKTR